MAVEDYNTTPSLNTTLASTSLQEGQTRHKDINDIIRQMLTDIKNDLAMRFANAAALQGKTFATGTVPKTAIINQLGIYWYDSTDTTTADNGTTVIVTTSGERFKQFGPTASAVSIVDAGSLITATDVEAALQELAGVTTNPLHNKVASTTLTISTGAITPTLSSHIIAAESGTTDDLDTITTTNFNTGDTIKIVPDTGDTITVKDGTGNIETTGGGDFALDASQGEFAWVHVKASGVIAVKASGGASMPAFIDAGASEYNVQSGSGNWVASAWQAVIDAANTAATTHDSVTILVPGKANGGSAEFYVDAEWPPFPEKVSVESYGGVRAQFRCEYQPRFEHADGTGSKTSFTFNHQIDASSDIVVYVMEDIGGGTLAPVRQVITTDYTLSGVPGSSVTIQFTAAPATGTKNVFAYHIRYGGFINIESAATHFKGILINAGASITKGAGILIHNNASRAWGDDTLLEHLQVSTNGEWSFNILYNGAEKTSTPGVRDFMIRDVTMFRASIAKICLLTCNGANVTGIKGRDGGIDAEYYDVIVSGDSANKSNNVYIQGDTLTDVLIDQAVSVKGDSTSSTNVTITSNASSARFETPDNIYSSENIDIEIEPGQSSAGFSNSTAAAVRIARPSSTGRALNLSGGLDLITGEENADIDIRRLDSAVISSQMLMRCGTSTCDFFGVTSSVNVRHWAGNVLVMTLNATTQTLDFDVAPKLKSNTVAGAPSASTLGAGTMIYVSDETGGAVVAFSDGTNWRRVTDRAVIA